MTNRVELSRYAGVRAPMVQAPLGTYCGWNLRARGFGHGASTSLGQLHPVSECGRKAYDRRSVPLDLERFPTAEALRRGDHGGRAAAGRGGSDARRGCRANCRRRPADCNRPRYDVRLN